MSSSGPEYRLLREDEILAEQQRIINEVASILEIPAECANTLLIYFKWNKDVLFDKYYADPKQVRKEAGIQHLGVASRPSAAFMCEVCLGDCPASEGFGLGCKHVFCKGCWAGYLSAMVSDQGPNCIFTKCLMDGCGESVTRSVVSAMAPREAADRWLQFELKHFVSISKNMTWCPAPGCSNAFVARVPVKTAQCSCGMKFCFRCGKESHAPVNCDMLDKWLAKCGNESETANWILSNTKKCPQCAVRIEKNQGCNHIVCRNKGCKYEFCWICSGPWSEHGQSTGGYYKCNKYRSVEVNDTAPGAGGAEARAKAELDKYLFYFQRYNNHDAAGRFAAKHRETTQKRMAELQSTAVTSWADVGFLESATEALLEVSRNCCALQLLHAASVG
jgi:ariadne-1